MYIDCNRKTQTHKDKQKRQSQHQDQYNQQEKQWQQDFEASTTPVTLLDNIKATRIGRRKRNQKPRHISISSEKFKVVTKNLRIHVFAGKVLTPKTHL